MNDFNPEHWSGRIIDTYETELAAQSLLPEFKAFRRLPVIAQLRCPSCKVPGHASEHHRDFDSGGPGQHWRVTYKCGRCGYLGERFHRMTFEEWSEWT
jgi:hypothetical protein